MTPTKSAINAMRPVWRAITLKLKDQCPNIVCRVQLYEGGDIIAIYECAHGHVLEGDDRRQVCRTLREAEDLAVNFLCEVDGIGDE